jgi:hypothetical protein
MTAPAAMQPPAAPDVAPEREEESAERDEVAADEALTVTHGEATPRGETMIGGDGRAAPEAARTPLD